MAGISKSNFLLQFAALSLVIVAALGAAFGFLGQRIIVEKIQDSAASTVTNTIRPPLEASLADTAVPLTSTSHEDFEGATAGLISDQTLLIRLWNREGLAVFSTKEGDAGNGFLGQNELQRAFDG